MQTQPSTTKITGHNPVLYSKGENFQYQHKMLDPD